MLSSIRPLLPTAILLALIAYFGCQALTGDRGLLEKSARTAALQMESAELERTTVDITAKVGGRTLDLRATGQVVKFDCFLALYQEATPACGTRTFTQTSPILGNTSLIIMMNISAG